MANALPKEGGFADLLAGGTKNLVSFGKELASFGPYIKVYGDSINGLDSSSVEASANAAKMLTDVANSIPKDGGAIEWFSGKRNTLVDFGKELASFAPYIKTYSDAIAGVNMNNVESSANAVKILADMAKNLPADGGWVDWFVGKTKSLTDFGEELANFGPSIKQYSLDVNGINIDSVESSINAAKILSDMAKNLPADGGWVDWFVGNEEIGRASCRERV